MEVVGDHMMWGGHMMWRWSQLETAGNTGAVVWRGETLELIFILYHIDIDTTTNKP